MDDVVRDVGERVVPEVSDAVLAEALRGVACRLEHHLDAAVVREAAARLDGTARHG